MSQLVLHVVGEDTPPSRAETCAVLQAHTRKATRSRRAAALVHFGPGRAPAPCDRPTARVPASAFSAARSFAGRIEEMLSWRSETRFPARELILHVWSPRAVPWALRIARTTSARLLIDAEFPAAGPALAKWHTSGAARGVAALHFICPTAHAQRRMLESGVPLDRTALIRACVDFAAFSVDVEAVRGDLRFGASQRVALVLPPLEKVNGGRLAAWAAMLAEKVLPDLRLVVPGAGAEVERLRHLVRSCRHEGMARFPGERWALPALLRAADAALCLPAGDAPVGALAWAMAAGTPIVATATPCVTEWLAHGATAWLAHPEDPRDAAHRLLQALEDAPRARRQADEARRQAFELFSRQRMIEEFDGVYAGSNSTPARPALQ